MFENLTLCGGFRETEAILHNSSSTSYQLAASLKLIHKIFPTLERYIFKYAKAKCNLYHVSENYVLGATIRYETTMQSRLNYLSKQGTDLKDNNKIHTSMAAFLSGNDYVFMFLVLGCPHREVLTELKSSLK